MNNFSDNQYWQKVGELISLKTHLGLPWNWNKSTIESFIFSFLESLEKVCKANERKATLCKVPKIGGQYHYSQLNLSYDSFRRIFITKESRGSKTTKHMFAIYLGYGSYLELWTGINNPKQYSPKCNTFSVDTYYYDGRITEKFATLIDRQLLSMINKLEKVPFPESDIFLESIIDKEVKNLFIGVANFQQSNWKTSALYFDKSIALFEKHFQFFFMAGIAYYNIRIDNGSFDKALDYFNTAIRNLSIDSDNDLKARLYTYKGATLKRQTNYSDALNWVLKGLSFAEHEHEKARAHYNLACIYALKDDQIELLESLKYLKTNNEKYFLQAQRYIRRWVPKHRITGIS